MFHNNNTLKKSMISVAFGGQPFTQCEKPFVQLPTPTPSEIVSLKPCPMWIFFKAESARVLCRAYIKDE